MLNDLYSYFRCASYFLPQRDFPSCYYTAEPNCTTIPIECLNKTQLILRYLTDTNFYSYETSNNVVLNKHLTYTLMFYHFDVSDKLDYYNQNFQGKSLSNKHIRLRSVFNRDSEKYDLFSEYLLSDAIYFGLAMGLIVLLELMYLFSIALVVATALSVVMSLSTAYAIYIGVFGFNFFPFINLLSSLIIIAVGADDVFIIYTTWQRAKEDTPGVSGTFYYVIARS